YSWPGGRAAPTSRAQGNGSPVHAPDGRQTATRRVRVLAGHLADPPCGPEGETDSSEYGRISDLMDAATPQTTADHVLVASYWFQVIQGKEDFTSQEVNAELKDLGQASKNITDSFSTLMKRKPPAVRQVQKTGSTRQARKKYRLTEPGIRTVQRMLRG